MYSTRTPPIPTATHAILLANFFSWRKASGQGRMGCETHEVPPHKNLMSSFRPLYSVKSSPNSIAIEKQSDQLFIRLFCNHFAITLSCMFSDRTESPEVQFLSHSRPILAHALHFRSQRQQLRVKSAAKERRRLSAPVFVVVGRRRQHRFLGRRRRRLPFLSHSLPHSASSDAQSDPPEFRSVFRPQRRSRH